VASFKILLFRHSSEETKEKKLSEQPVCAQESNNVPLQCEYNVLEHNDVQIRFVEYGMKIRDSIF
jgi:hypothetical protein